MFGVEQGTLTTAGRSTHAAVTLTIERSRAILVKLPLSEEREKSALIPVSFLYGAGGRGEKARIS